MHDNEKIVKISDEISLKNKRMWELENLKKEILYDLKKDLITNDDYDFYFETYNNEMKKLLKELKKLKENEFTLSHNKRIPSCTEETISNKNGLLNRLNLY